MKVVMKHFNIWKKLLLLIIPSSVYFSEFCRLIYKYFFDNSYYVIIKLILILNKKWNSFVNTNDFSHLVCWGWKSGHSPLR